MFPGLLEEIQHITDPLLQLTALGRGREGSFAYFYTLSGFSVKELCFVSSDRMTRWFQ